MGHFFERFFNKIGKSSTPFKNQQKHQPIPEMKIGPSAVNHKEAQSRHKDARLAALIAWLYNAECGFLGFAERRENFFSGIIIKQIEMV